MRMRQMRVSPANGQVVLYVPDTDDLPPQMITGRERVVANAGWIAVSTIADMDEDVAIEVWMHDEPPYPHAEPVYDGTLYVHDASAFVGSLLGDHLAEIGLREGEHQVRVYTEPQDADAERVYFVID